MQRILRTGLVAFLAGMLVACGTTRMDRGNTMTLDYGTAPTPKLQTQVEEIDARLRGEMGMGTDETAVGVLDLRTGSLAMVQPDRIEYGASVPKIGILLAYFALRADGSQPVDETTRSELGMMVKRSSNEMAAKYSQLLGLKNIQGALERHGFYDAARGGGIWVGKHYGVTGERYGDPVGDHSHAVTVRQLLRFYLLLEQRRLVSAEASEEMLRIFESPELPHDEIKFVKGLRGRDREILRKWGSWEDWLHDSAIIRGPDRRYILVGLTRHSRGDDYLERLAREIDEVMGSR